jgi:hypothetical protein
MNRPGKQILLFSLLLAPAALYGQNYIGMHKDSIQKVIRKDFPDFRIDNSTTNSVYKYLKMVDRVNEQTVLFFLSDNNKCTRVRWMSDYSNLDDIRKLLDGRYKRMGDKRWVYRSGGKISELPWMMGTGILH